MALLLNAEQKSLSTLFTGQELYTIPAYQRPYSWGEEQCQKLYDDIVMSFNDNRDYFLGNIIEAVSEQTRKEPRVVDGQQRLISIWLMFKALSLLMPSIKVLPNTLCSFNWDGTVYKLKIHSEVIESEDEKTLQEIYRWSRQAFDSLLECSQGRIHYRYTGSHLKSNALFFYKTYRDFMEQDGPEKLTLFLQFLLERVCILPIEMSGVTLEEAEDRALTIFETINNRGMNLEDADIFKAKLYNKAVGKEEKRAFMSSWVHIKETCEELDMKIDDLFRYYYHVVRGIQGNTKSEISLREFFTSPTSILTQKSHTEVVDDLIRLTQLIAEFDKKKREPTQLAAWLQLIDIYTNNYPRFAVMAYLFHNGFDNEHRLITLLKKIVRYCYYMGSTTFVKYGIYTIIKQVSNNMPVDDFYRDEITTDDFDYLGRLKYGYALLAYYLKEPKAIPDYDTIRLLTMQDEQTLPADWQGKDFRTSIDDLGNLAVVRDTHRRYGRYAEKVRDFSNIDYNQELAAYLKKHPETISFAALEKRGNRLKQRLVNFFRSPEIQQP